MLATNGSPPPPLSEESLQLFQSGGWSRNRALIFRLRNGGSSSPYPQRRKKDD